MTYQAFFFDFDGVLTDSMEIKTRAYAKLFKSHGADIVAKVVSHHRRNGGMARQDKFQHYFKAFLKQPLDDVQMEQLCNSFSSLVVEEVASCPEIQGAEDFLKRWHKKVFCFVVSAAPDGELSEIIERRRWNGYFREVLGSARSKQEHIAFLIKKYDLEPGKCLFFGDAESDYRAAMSSKVKFMGVLPSPDAPLLGIAPNINWTKNFDDLKRVN